MEISPHKFEFVSNEGKVYRFARCEAINEVLTLWDDKGEIIYAGCIHDGYIRQISEKTVNND